MSVQFNENATSESGAGQPAGGGGSSDSDNNDDPGSHVDETAERVEKELLIPDPNCEELYLEHYRIGKIEHLEVLTRCSSVCLRNNLLKKIEGFDVGLIGATLTHLDLYDNQIEVMENLSPLVNLEILDLSFNRIRHIHGLETNNKLKRLFFVHNKIREIRNLESLTELEMLELGDNRLRKLENIGHMTKLRELFVGKNKIRRIENLDSLENLKVLSIQSNRITKIEGLSNLKALEDLYISHNGLSKLEGLENITSIITLDIAGNRIARIENVGHLSQMEEFWANDNQISEWKCLDALAQAKSLQCVYLERNPIYRDTMYRRKIMLTLPWLNQIDSVSVPPSAIIPTS